MEESVIARAGAFMMDADGNFYVEDRGNTRIAVYGPDGKYRLSIGRRGNGPGEFSQWGMGLVSVEGGTVQVYDSMLRRTTLFRSSGDLLETVRRPDSMRGSNIQFLPASERFFCETDRSQPRGELLSYRAGFVVTDADGDTVGWAELPPVASMYRTHRPWAGLGNEYTYFPMPFAASPGVVLAGDRNVFTYTGTDPELRRYSLDGSLTGRYRLDLEPRPVTSQEKEAELKRLDEQIASAEGRRKDDFKVRREAIRFPQTKAFWRTVSVDRDGHFWLRVPESDEVRTAQGGGYLHLLLSPEGEFLGRSRTPDTGSVYYGHFLGIVRDPETGEETPTVWRLNPAAAGFRYP
jgi:hypothetical protein